MQTKDALAALKDAKLEKRDWREVSGIVNEILSSRAWRGEFENMSAWLEAAGEISGYSSSMLRRMVAVRDFLDREKETYGEPNILVDTTTRAPFAAMELLKRIHDIDPSAAKEVFGKILSSDVSHRDVQATYQELSGTGKLSWQFPNKHAGSQLRGSRAGRGQVNAFLQVGDEILRRNLSDLTGDSQARCYFRAFRFQYVPPLAVALRFKDNGIAWVDAFDFRRPNRTAMARGHKQMLAEVAFGATFFRNYWIIVDERDDIAEVLTRDVRALGLHSVGIAEIDTDDLGKFRIHQKPELGAQPDRQAQTIKEIMGQGIPDLVEF